jgi:hypothetical protein
MRETENAAFHCQNRAIVPGRTQCSRATAGRPDGCKRKRWRVLAGERRSPPMFVCASDYPSEDSRSTNGAVV